MFDLPRFEPIPRPDYASAAPSDWLGARAIEVMLADLPFPDTVEGILGRAGRWEVPVAGSDRTVPLAKLLDGVPKETRFASAAAVARGVRALHHGW